jgi:hypothetical protein
MIANTKQNLIDMFLDRTADESTSENRLTTEETESGNIALIAYGWLKVAEYNESREAVTVFTGHKSLNSKTISRYLNNVVARADERSRDVILSGESPTVDTPNEGTKFINSYVSFSGNRSDVEAEAVATVRDSLSHLS